MIINPLILIIRSINLIILSDILQAILFFFFLSFFALNFKKSMNAIEKLMAFFSQQNFQSFFWSFFFRRKNNNFCKEVKYHSYDSLIVVRFLIPTFTLLRLSKTKRSDLLSRNQFNNLILLFFLKFPLSKLFLQKITLIRLKQ